MTRTRQITQIPTVHGKSCNPNDKEEIVPCNTQPCKKTGCVDGDALWGEWDSWSPCSATCGGGVTFRTRKITRMAKPCGNPVTGPDRESVFCNVDKSCSPSVDCTFSEWGEWTDCTASCDGIKRRSRRIGKYGRGDGAYCIGGLKETYPCNPAPNEDFPAACEKEQPEDCVFTSWKEWSTCAVSCGGGSIQRHREVQQSAKFGGKACDGALTELKECARTACPGPVEKDCVFGDWQDWGACGKCGGQRKRFRSITQYATDGGRNCDIEGHEETGKCNRICHARQYCTWSNWMEWGGCMETCGTGTRTRRRYLTLSETKAEPPAPQLIGKYAEFGERMETFRSGRIKDLMLAFSGGCCSFLLIMGIVRVFSPSRQHARNSLQSINAREESTFSRESRESEIPLVGVAPA